MPVSDLYDIAHDLLAVVNEAVDNTPPGGVVTRGALRSGAAWATPPMDCCPAATVHLESLETDRGNQNSLQRGGTRFDATCQQPLVATYVITYTWCLPTGEGGEAPSVTDMDRAGRELMEIARLIFTRLQCKKNLGLDRCTVTGLGTLRAIDASGGCGGWTLPVEVRLTNAAGLCDDATP